ncbi:MAG TPA: hypothetical protein VK589_05410 [Chryseolinea sp.]|nr:hypothetical protein [Chryseolinea sp.]
MKTCVAILFLLASTTAITAQKYLGQPLPGPVPAVFAPGLISTQGLTEFGSIFSKDGTEFFYAAEPGGVAQIRHMKLINGKWTDAKTIMSHNVYSYNDPFLSPDEKRLYFISNMPLSGSGEKKDYDIWYIVREGNGWSAPKNAGSNINSPGNEYYMSFTKAGTMYFSSNGKATDEKKENYDIYASRNVKGEFQTPVKLPETINTQFYEADVFVDPEETYVIFCANKPGGNGRGDLYISYKSADATWQPAKNLGKEINAERTEYCPFVTSDGQYFFFTKEDEIWWVEAKFIKSLR